MTKSDSKIGLHNNQSDVDDEDDVNNNSNNETKQNQLPIRWLIPIDN